ncbi:hypothetical protein HELRODRAFT_92073 [Helobdella robusta]|uniref:B30.2/SPRY domain-containing protein n=1 Tax=Helobdella robusta TaxID=6412 RepID=T1G8B9_HELRO|nr:hypothetical protein HELRODRAFT_92073 [Helobdella robusta]ESO09769.1 hypothetical protein HELRODRAFT_92073 [Helobdella robusta]
MKNKNLGYERTYFEITYEWPRRLDEILSHEPANQEKQLKHSWNPDDRSLNIFIKPEDPQIIHRHPVAQSTDCIRGKVGHSQGLHYWEITWNQQQRGTHPIVGVATKDAPLHCPGYRNLIGSNKYSWGWDIAKHTIIHNSIEKTLTFVNGIVERRRTNSPCDRVIPDTFGMILDMDEGTLGFVIDKKYTGIAFGGLKGKTLYPVVNTVWGHCEVQMRYIASIASQPRSLLETSRKLIEKCVLDKSYSENFSTLPIPKVLESFRGQNRPSHSSGGHPG